MTRPSDALAAKQAADKAFTGLLLGLGAVALLVGGIGVANTMVISVLERRARSACAAPSAPPEARSGSQFLAEALLLSALGGVGGRRSRHRGHGVVFAVTRAGRRWYRRGRWPAGSARPCVIGAIAGLYPAIRAARAPPTEALSG